MKIIFLICDALGVLVHHETLIQYLKDRHILKDLGNKPKNHSQYIVGLAIEVEMPPVTGCHIL